MRFTSGPRLAVALTLAAAALAARAQNKINPNTGVNWPAATCNQAGYVYSWYANACISVGGSGTVTDGSGTTTQYLLPISTGAAHVLGYSGITTNSTGDTLNVPFLTSTPQLNLTAVAYSPTTPITAALAGAGAGSVDNGTHGYEVVCETASGHTSFAPISNTVTVADNTTNGQVSLTNIPSCTGTVPITGKQLYRSKAGLGACDPAAVNNGCAYYALGSPISSTSTTYTDNVADASLGAGMPTVNTAMGTVGDNGVPVYNMNVQENSPQNLGINFNANTPLVNFWDENFSSIPFTSGGYVGGLFASTFFDGDNGGLYLQGDGNQAGANDVTGPMYFEADDTDTSLTIGPAFGFVTLKAASPTSQGAAYLDADDQMLGVTNGNVYGGESGSAWQFMLMGDGSFVTTPTWNNSANTYNGWDMELTNTASSASSSAIYIHNDTTNTDIFSVSPSGNVGAAGTVTATGYPAASGGSTANCWNTNGTTTACGSGSAAFSSLTSGTNTGAAMLVGSGASLGVTGSGTIGATTLLGDTWASPGAIGGTTPNTGVFTTLNVKTSYNNEFFGVSAGGNGGGSSNTAFGDYSGGSYNSLTGGNNTSFGFSALRSLTSGGSNTAYGNNALETDVSGSGNAALGNYAGYNETGSNDFYVNNVQESSLANDKAYSLLYGTFSGTAASLTGQQLTVNGQLTLSGITGSTQCLQANSSGVISGTGSSCGSGALTVGSTTISSGTNGDIEYNNSGVLGEKTTTGSGSVVLASAPDVTSMSVEDELQVNGSISLSGGISLLSGGSTSNCFNTDGSTTVCGASTATIAAATNSALGSGGSYSAPACASGWTCDGLSGMVTFTTGTSPTTNGGIFSVTLGTARSAKVACVFGDAMAFDSIAPLAGSLYENTLSASTTIAEAYSYNLTMTANTQYEASYTCGR